MDPFQNGSGTLLKLLMRVGVFQVNLSELAKSLGYPDGQIPANKAGHHHHATLTFSSLRGIFYFGFFISFFSHEITFFYSHIYILRDFFRFTSVYKNFFSNHDFCKKISSSLW